MAAMDEFLEGLIEIEPEVPQSFTWPIAGIAGSQDYTCFASGFTRGAKLEHFGWNVDDDGVIVVRAALFGDGPFPMKDQTLVFEEITYRIDRVMSAPGSTFLRLFCVNASRGA